MALTEPVQRTPDIVVGSPTPYSGLDSNQVYQLQIARERYNLELKRFDRRDLEIKKFWTEIVNRVARQNLIYITAATDTRDMLLQLYKQLAPSAAWRNREIINRHTKLRDTQPQRMNIANWLSQWERVFWMERRQDYRTSRVGVHLRIL
jgi:hypothetical protein